MLRVFRIVIAIISICAMTFLFVDAIGFGASYFDWLARLQFMPALLALNFLVLLGLVLATLLFGRIYCSIICPLGIFQDVVARIRKWTSKKTRRKIGLYSYSPARSKTRMAVFFVFVVVVMLGALNVAAVSLASFIEPYSAFGRMVTAFANPVFDGINNWLADMSAEDGTYTFVTVHRVTSALIFVVACLTLVFVGLFAWFTGRDYCNRICPVGTILGVLARYSWLKPVINSDICNGCHSCERHCKSNCIDSASKAIDYTRCVDCMDCISVCRQGAISYRHPSKTEAARKVSLIVNPKTEKPAKVDKKRRAFLATSGLITGAFVAKAAEATVGKVTDGGLTALKDRQSPKRTVRMIPPGAISQAHINAHCVGCQLCIQACPNGLLTPSTDIMTLMQPVMDYTNDYCHTECTACSNICPAGVYVKLDEPTKASWKIGTAKVDLELCLAANGASKCGNCERHCPAGAITMAEKEDGSVGVMPVVNEALCIGCGACEFNCPVGTIEGKPADVPAIHVEGVSTQRTI